MKKFGLIGKKLGHSFSGLIHEKLGRYSYELWPIEKEKLHDFMTNADFDGINVTIPYKKDVIPYLDEISEEARLCGAVNTVVRRDGKLYGYNTDIFGMKNMLRRAGIALKDKNVLILGSGGTSGTARCLCKMEGAKRIERVSRTAKDGAISYEDALTRKDTEVILNTTPVGMYPNMGISPIDLTAFPKLEAVADAIYNPLKSQILLEGEKLGVRTTGGLSMLVSQAMYAARLFVSDDSVLDCCEEITKDIYSSKENIVLTGMPGSGKSTIGKALADAMGREFFDSDEEIVREAGKPIPQIFAEDGEGAFRDLESRVIRSLGEKEGIVLATGGGAVLREKNIDILRGNGRIFFLDAALATLVSTADRPLSSTPEALRQRYEERYDIYRATADVIVPVTRNLEENLKAIQKEIL